MRIVGLDHMVLTVRDLEATLHFYVDILGLELDSRGGRHALRFGDQKINLHRRKAEFLPAAANVAYGSADFCLVAHGNIGAIRDLLVARGGTLEIPDIVDRNGALGPMRSVYLRDPDGNLVEIAVYPESGEVR